MADALLSTTHSSQRTYGSIPESTFVETSVSETLGQKILRVIREFFSNLFSCCWGGSPTEESQSFASRVHLPESSVMNVEESKDKSLRPFEAAVTQVEVPKDQQGVPATRASMPSPWEEQQQSRPPRPFSSLQGLSTEKQWLSNQVSKVARLEQKEAKLQRELDNLPPPLLWWEINVTLTMSDLDPEASFETLSANATANAERSSLKSELTKIRSELRDLNTDIGGFVGNLSQRGLDRDLVTQDIEDYKTQVKERNTFGIY